MEAKVPWSEWLANHEKGWRQERDERYFDAVAKLLTQGKEEGFPTVSKQQAIQASYVAMRLDGQSHALAEMFALGQPPMSNTDREFLESHCNGSQFEKMPAIGDFYAREARKAGVDPKGKIYVAGLASYPGDPTAWVGSRGDVERVCKEKGFSCQGAVTVAKSEREPEKDVDVAGDIVEQAVAKRLEADPSLAFKDQGELAHDVKEAIKPHWCD